MGEQLLPVENLLVSRGLATDVVHLTLLCLLLSHLDVTLVIT